MDVSVSRLTNRMALHLPAEFPLGLLFVTGQVAHVVTTPNEPIVQFELVDGQHRLRCRMPATTAGSMQLRPGDDVRVTGHLIFESRSASYTLRARDVVRLQEERLFVAPQSVPDLPSLWHEIDEPEVGPQGGVTPAGLPAWVQRLAPTERGRAVPQPAHEPTLSEEPTLDPKLLDFLSDAIDRSEEVEITPALLARFGQTAPQPQPRGAAVMAAPAAGPIDWVVVTLIGLVFVLTLVTLYALVIAMP